jgi:oligopeptide/dipeptide ABC transporter ATP-binding protein
MGLILITHDMGVVAETADRVVVQYAGRQVESNTTLELFSDPHHPYTAALLAALPERAEGHARLEAIPGVVPGQFDRPAGCVFSPRCAFATEVCRSREPAVAREEMGLARCHTPLPTGGSRREHCPRASDLRATTSCAAHVRRHGDVSARRVHSPSSGQDARRRQRVRLRQVTLARLVTMIESRPRTALDRRRRRGDGRRRNAQAPAPRSAIVFQNP